MAQARGDSVITRIRIRAMARVRAVVRRLIRPILLKEPSYAARFIAYRGDEPDFVFAKPAPLDGKTPVPLPVPPSKLWVATGPGGYGETEREYLENGREQVQRIVRTLEGAGGGLQPGDRVLEFGCASGRLLRWFQDHAQTGEVWGVDIDSEQIVWCQQHLTPPFRFCTTTTAPHLPFEDRSFNFIYAGSVFSHIGELADAWFLELRRLLVPGGHLYVTIIDKHSLEIVRDNPSFNLATRLEEARARIRFDEMDFAMLSVSRSYTVYDREYLTAMLEPNFEVLAVELEAYGFQTGILLRRPI